jgi:hypothetical protein
MERKDEKGSEEDDYFNKFPPTLPLSLLPLLHFPPSLLSSSYYLSPFFLSFLLTASLPPF